MTELLTSTVLEQLELGNITRDDAKAQIATIVQQAQQAAAGAGATAAAGGGSADMRMLVAEIIREQWESQLDAKLIKPAPHFSTF